MWFEVNVRLSEVTDLKWPHGTEWQCGNSTLAMSWPNHVQILSFASMASRQGAVKHGFVSKIVGGCSSYDVIARNLTWPGQFFFYQKLRKVCPTSYSKTRRRVAPPFFRYLRKTSGGVHQPPPVWARVNRSVNPRLTGVSAERHWPRFHGQVRLRTAQLRLRASCPADGTHFHGLIPH